MKKLIERRNALIEEAQGLITTARTEERALNDTEIARFDAIQTEISTIDETLRRETEARGMTPTTTQPAGGTQTPTAEEQRALDEQAFAGYCRAHLQRGGSAPAEIRDLGTGSNGVIIPTTISSRIIETVREISPIYRLATVYNLGGDLAFPVWGSYVDSGTTHKISAAYVADMTELTEDTGKFTIVKLENLIIGSLAKVSRSLMNRTDFDLVSFIVNEVAKAIAEFLEQELLVGTGSSAMTGAVNTTNTMTAAAVAAVTADELIDLQMMVPERYQANACWIMNKSTFKSIRELKDSQNQYLLVRDFSKAGAWTILDKPVYVSESMPTMAAAEKAILYGDMSGLYVKLAQNIEIQVLVEKYATQHAVGVVGYVEADSKVVEPQKIAVLTMAAS